MRNLIASALIAASVVLVPTMEAQPPEKLVHRIESAHAILHELMNTPDKGVPLDIAASAQCIVVVPSFKKGAFVFGGEYGQGVASCRTEHGWSAPVFVQLAGASFGFHGPRPDRSHPQEPGPPAQGQSQVGRGRFRGCRPCGSGYSGLYNGAGKR